MASRTYDVIDNLITKLGSVFDTLKTWIESESSVEIDGNIGGTTPGNLTTPVLHVKSLGSSYNDGKWGDMEASSTDKKAGTSMTEMASFELPGGTYIIDFGYTVTTTNLANIECCLRLNGNEKQDSYCKIVASGNWKAFTHGTSVVTVVAGDVLSIAAMCSATGRVSGNEECVSWRVTRIH